VVSLVQLSGLQGVQELGILGACCFTNDDAVRSLTAFTQLTRLGLSDSDGVYSTVMQLQLLQQFGQGELDDRTCHVIGNKVGTSCSGCAVQSNLNLITCCNFVSEALVL